MIAVRKEIDAFADFNNRELLEVENPHLFVFGRQNTTKQTDRVLVVANFDSKPQSLNLNDVDSWTNQNTSQMIDLISGQSPDIFKDTLIMPGFGFYWLKGMM
jgi:amylosucrase